MNFKKFIRRMNRGVALGLVFFLSMTVFIVVDEQRFKKEGEDIQKMVLDYFGDIGKLNIEVSSTMTVGEKATKAQAAEAKSKMEDLLLNYYTSGKITNAYGSSKEDILVAYESYLKTVEASKITKQDFAFSAGFASSGIEISKYGPGGAIVYVSGECVIEFVGKRNDFMLFYPGNRAFYGRDERYYDYNGEETKPNQEEESLDKPYLAIFSVNGRLYLNRKDGKWKIVMDSSNCFISRGPEEVLQNEQSISNFSLMQEFVLPKFRKYATGGKGI